MLCLGESVAKGCQVRSLVDVVAVSLCIIVVNGVQGVGSIVPMLGESPGNSKTDVGWGDSLDTSSSVRQRFQDERLDVPYFRCASYMAYSILLFH